MRGKAGTFQAPEEVVSAPLALRVSVTVDADKFGGAAFTSRMVIQSDAVSDVVVGFDRSSIPSALTAFPGDELIRGTLNLGVETAGGLLVPDGSYHKWTVTELEGVAPATGEFFAMVDGPLLAWASARDMPAKLLAEVADLNTPSRLRESAIGIRAIAVLASLQGRPDVARGVVAAYVPESEADTERFPLFERELAARFPEYGPRQR